MSVDTKLLNEWLEPLRSVGGTDFEAPRLVAGHAWVGFRYRGARFFSTAMPWGKGTIPQVGVVAPPPGARRVASMRRWPLVRATRKTGLQRLGERCGVCSPTPTGDAAFDERVMLDGDAPLDERLALVQSPDARQALIALLDDPDVSCVHFGDKGGMVSMAYHATANGRLGALLDRLGWLAVTLPHADEPAGEVALSALGMTEVLLWLLAAMFSWLGPVVVLESITPYAGSYGGRVAGVSAAVIAVGLLVQVVRARRRTWGTRVFVASLVSLLPTTPALVASGVIVLNDRLPSPRRTRRVSIEYYRCEATRNGKVCEARVRVLDGGATLWFDGSKTKELDETAVPGVTGSCGPGELVDHPGALGYPVLVALRRTPDGNRFTVCQERGVRR